MLLETDIEFSSVIDKKDKYNLVVPEEFSWVHINSNDDKEMVFKKKLMSKPPNQYKCGSCWAMSVASCVSDSFVVSGYKFNPEISTTYALSLFPQSKCKGGSPVQLLQDIEKHGISIKKCIDYSWCEKSALCNGSALTHWNNNGLDSLIPSVDKNIVDCKELFFVTSINRIALDSYEDISEYERKQDMAKHHIKKYGPIIGGFVIFKNFMDGSFTKNIDTKGIYFENFKDGKYSSIHTTHEEVAGCHAVSILGWGIERGVKIDNNGHLKKVPFWICRNSWGHQWGNEGYFKIAMFPYNRKAQFIKRISIKLKNSVQTLGGVLTFKPVLNNELHGSINKLDKSNNKIFISCLISVLVFIVVIIKL